MAWTARGIGASFCRRMRASLVVVFLICFEQMTKVPLAKHNDMIEARTSVLPWLAGFRRGYDGSAVACPLDLTLPTSLARGQRS